MSDTPADIKIAPNSKESEMMVLGCMLTSVNSLNIASDGLRDSDFYYTEHKTIFLVLQSAYRSEKPADVHLVCEELKRQNKLEAVGGIGYVAALAQYASTSAYIEEYVALVRNKAILRRMISAAQVVEKKALEDPQNVFNVLDEAQQLFFKISQASSPLPGVTIREILAGNGGEIKVSYLKELEEKQNRFREMGADNPGVVGIPSHFTDLDKLLSGLNRSNLNILAARPAMGKTAFALNLAENVCFKSKVPVGIFSLEMSAEQLVHRLVCSQANVESDKIKTGSLNGIEYQRIVAAVNFMQEHTMIIEDQPGLSITDLRARARRMKELYGVEFIVIDYLQLLNGGTSGKGQDSRQNEISEISRGLKNLARELNVPILCLSQLSRKVEERTGHRPMMSDLRESGCLAGDTLIKDADTGKLITIKELAEREEQTPLNVFAVNHEMKVGKHLMTKVFYSGKKQTYLLKTRTGRSIKASANHPFLMLSGWTRLDQLNPGDRIALPRDYKSHSQSPHSKDELALLAHLLGDGCILPKQPYHYTSADDANIQTVSTAAKKLFDIDARLVKQKNWTHAYLPSPYRLTHGKKHPITNWFEKLGIERVRSYDKRLPKTIVENSSSKIAFFLHHLWATDGNISEKNLKGRKPSAAIYYASSSSVLSEQVQHLLLCLGIQSTLGILNSNKGYRPMYHVNIQGVEHQKKFLTMVGSAGSRGNAIPSLIQNLNQIESNPNCDIIPKEAWQIYVKQAKDRKEMSWRDLSKALTTSYSGSSLMKSGISRKRLHLIANVLEDEKLSQVASSDIYWDEITSIELLEIEDVYDATVPEVHNFVANDIIVHNSIEQDADIVMFLLRREYYDPNDRPGQAELIIGKNRHGSVGSVMLTFRKEYAQFVNYTPVQAGMGDDVAIDDAAYAAFSPE